MTDRIGRGADDTVLLQVKHLRQYFGENDFPAVDDVSFDIKKGEVFGLVGESGCGKTTTGRSIIKLYNITGGEIFFKGRRISAGLRDYTDAMFRAKRNYKVSCAAYRRDGTPELISQKKAALGKFLSAQREAMKRAEHDNTFCNEDYRHYRYTEIRKSSLSDEQKKEMIKEEKRRSLITHIQMIFQDPVTSLDPRMTVREIIAEGLRIQGITDEKYIVDSVDSALKHVGLLSEYADRYPHEFSGGQRQRIGVARAIIMNPELIIADEPVSALDVSIQAQVINLLNDLRHEMGLTILFIAHDLSVVKYFSDRIAVMYLGKLMELATSDDLFAHPLHPYTKALLSAIPLPDPRYEKHRRRILYTPTQNDSTTDDSAMREVYPGHLVRCTLKEFAVYRTVI